MSEKITCPSCDSLNCDLSYSRPFMCGTKGECHYRCEDCRRSFYVGIKEYKDMKEYYE